MDLDDDFDIFAQFAIKTEEKNAAEGDRRKRLPSYPGRSNAAPFNVQQLAKEHTEAAMETILDIMNDGEAENCTRLEAAKEILNRGWGKPAMSVRQERVTYTMADLENKLLEHRQALDDKIAEARRIESERLGEYFSQDAEVVEDVAPCVEGSLQDCS